MANWAGLGIGINAGLGTFGRTVNAGQAFKQLRNEQEIEGVRKQALTDATAEREGDIHGMMQEGAQATDAGPAQTFTIGNQSFKDEPTARKFAESQVSGVMDYFNKTLGPRIQQKYIEQGDTANAEKWSKFMDDSQTQRGMRSLAKANLSQLMGDSEGAMKQIVAGVNSAYGSQGYKIKDIEPLTDDDGNITGHRLNVIGPGGKKTTQDVPGGRDALMQMGQNLLAPDTQFKMWTAQQAAAEKAATERAQKSFEAALKSRGEQALEAQRQGGRQQLERIKESGQTARNQANIEAARDRTLLGITGAGQRRSGELQAETDYLRQQGLSDEEISAAAPQLVGIRQDRPQQDAGVRALSEIARTDFNYPNLTDQERDMAVRRQLEAQQRAQAISQGMGIGAGGQVRPPSVVMQPRPVQGLQIYDPATGRLMTR